MTVEGAGAASPLLPRHGRDLEGKPGSRPAVSLKPLVGGALSGILALFRAVSFGLCYAHKNELLVPSFGLFLQSLLIGTVLSQLVYGGLHALPWAMACPSSTGVPFNAALAGLVAARAATAEGAALQALLAMALASLGTAALFWLVGALAGPRAEALKGGFPQPLIFGLFGSVGISMVQGGLELVTGGTRPMVILALASGCLMRGATRSDSLGRHAAVLPALLTLQLAIFHALCAASGVPLEAARASGWLFDRFEAVSLLDYLSFWSQVFEPSNWYPGSQLDLGALLDNRALLTVGASMMPLLFLDLITVIAPFEAIERRALPLRREVGLAAGTCFLSGLAGCGAAYASLSPSKLCLEAGGGGGGRLASAAAVLVPVAGLTSLGPAMVSIMPKFLVAGLLVNLGLGYILEGLWDPRRVLSQVAPAEYLVIVVIVVCSCFVGLAEGIFVGLLVLSLLFVVRYAQGEVIQLACCAKSLPSLRSRRYRSADDWDALRPLLERVFLVRTTCSHLFFGSITSIVAASPQATAGRGPKQYLLLDLSSVRSVDSSAVAALRKFPASTAVLLAGLQDELVTQLWMADALKTLTCFRSVDAAIEKVEDLLLLELGRGDAARRTAEVKSERHLVPVRRGLTQAMLLPRVEVRAPEPLELPSATRILADCLPGAPPALLEALLRPGGRFAAERRLFVRGAVVCEEGKKCPGMMVCLRGSLTMYRGTLRLPLVAHETLGVDPNVKRLVGPRAGAKGRRLRGFGPGDVLGDASLLAPKAEKLSESLVAESGCELLLMGRELLMKLEAAPNLRLALELQKALARRLVRASSAALERRREDDVEIKPFTQAEPDTVAAAASDVRQPPRASRTASTGPVGWPGWA